MANRKSKRSIGQEIIASLQEFADVLESGEDFTKRFRCRMVAIELPRTRYTPQLVKKTRRLLGINQALFAKFLGVSLKTLHAWEQGINVPSDLAARFLDEIRHNPAYWTGRLEEAMAVTSKPAG